MERPKDLTVELTPEQAEIDAYPNFGTAMRRIIGEAEIPDGPIERVEFTFLASGEATYRVWMARAEEPTGGYLAPE